MNPDDPVPPEAVVSIKVFRFDDRDHPRVVLAVGILPAPGYKQFHLTRPVAYHSKRGKPSWLHRALKACEAALIQAWSEGRNLTFIELSSIAESHHKGQGVKKS